MRTIRVPVRELRVGDVELDTDGARYVSRVLRLRAGSRFVAFDPEARLEGDGEVISEARDRVRVRLGPTRPARLVPTREVSLVQCVGKGDKLDAVVRDATELGATAILAAIGERSVATRSTDAGLVRLRRIAVEAARQCGRGDVPRVEGPRPLASVLEGLQVELAIVLDPGGDERAGDLLQAGSRDGSVALVIGPEGGLTEAELGAAAAHGFHRASLGPLVLRTETVAAAALGALLILGQARGLLETGLSP